MHLVVNPLTNISPLVCPNVITIPLDEVICKISLVRCAIAPTKFSSTLPLTTFVRSNVSSTVWPGFNSIAILLVLKPLSFVFGSVSVVVNSTTVSYIVLPLADLIN
jgi:hypothetical protein